MRRSLLSFVFVIAGPALAHAQATLASRVAQAPDGVVRLEFDSRPGVCGDGRDVIAYRHAMFGRNFESYGRWNDMNCIAGPIRVALFVANGEVASMEGQVGGRWPATSGRVTELGTIPPREASAYFFSLVPRLETLSDKSRLLIPAVLADDAVVVPSLLALARDKARRDQTRRQAIQWLGLLGDTNVIAPLVGFAREDDGSDKKDLASSAVAALSYLNGGVGVPSLIDLSRTAPVGTRRNAVFWLGQSGDARALRRLHAVIDDGNEELEVRKNAIFSLGQSEEAPTSDLVGFYRTLRERSLREQTIFALSQRRDEAAMQALFSIARDDSDKDMRGKALFWLAQKHDPRVTKLISDMILK